MIILYAFILDLIVGDPEWLPHPVRAIGWLIKTIEKKIYHLNIHKKISGILLTATVVSLSFLLTFFLIKASTSIDKRIGFVIELILACTTLSVKSLYHESMKVYYSIKENSIESARSNLSRIVGRDTAHLDKSEIVRGAVETVAENIVDGIISPIFFMAIGGVPLAMAYKAANTLDSMVGYKNSRYENFGWASARLDDLLNYIPARLSFIFIVCAAFFCKSDWKKAMVIGLRDAKNSTSPNSGIPEATVAGALGIQIGGDNYYGGILHKKKVIGDSLVPLSNEHILNTNKIMIAASMVAVALALTLEMVLS